MRTRFLTSSSRGPLLMSTQSSAPGLDLSFSRLYGFPVRRRSLWVFGATLERKFTSDYGFRLVTSEPTSHPGRPVVEVEKKGGNHLRFEKGSWGPRGGLTYFWSL